MMVFMFALISIFSLMANNKEIKYKNNYITIEKEINYNRPYVRVGIASFSNLLNTLDPKMHIAPSIGFGYIKEISSLAIDSSLNCAVETDFKSKAQSVNLYGKMLLLKLLTPLEDSSVFLGIGIDSGFLFEGSRDLGPFFITGEFVYGYNFDRYSQNPKSVQIGFMLPCILGITFSVGF